jgi:hypothetical protein
MNASRPQDAPPAMRDVDVESEPAGAQVSLAGAVVGKTPFHGTLPRRKGDVSLMIRLAGYADRTVTVHGDQAIHQRVKLTAAAAAAPVRTRPANRDQSVNPFDK